MAVLRHGTAAVPAGGASHGVFTPGSPGGAGWHHRCTLPLPWRGVLVQDRNPRPGHQPVDHHGAGTARAGPGSVDRCRPGTRCPDSSQRRVPVPYGSCGHVTTCIHAVARSGSVVVSGGGGLGSRPWRFRSAMPGGDVHRHRLHRTAPSRRVPAQGRASPAGRPVGETGAWSGPERRFNGSVRAHGHAGCRPATGCNDPPGRDHGCPPGPQPGGTARPRGTAAVLHRRVVAVGQPRPDGSPEYRTCSRSSRSWSASGPIGSTHASW